MIPLKDKIAVITGAGSGIGAALARVLSEAGVFVTLTARRKDGLEAVADGLPGEALVVPGDITHESDREAIVERTMSRWGRIDLLFNNAGSGAYGSFMETTEELWRWLFEVNVFAPVLLTRRVIPIMAAQGQGLIVNLASIGGLMAHSDKVTPYVASKHALVGFSRGLVKDLAGTGIRVLAVCPHLTDTAFFQTGPGAEEMAVAADRFREYMDAPEAVARGILNQLDSGRLVVFPTDKPQKAYLKGRDI